MIAVALFCFAAMVVGLALSVGPAYLDLFTDNHSDEE